MKRTSLLCLLFLLCITCARAQKECASAAYLDLQLGNTPGLKEKLASIDKFISKHASNRERISGAGGSGVSIPVIKIPVVVHVVYNNAAQKISPEQVRSQLEVLNRDFRKMNEEVAGVPEQFRSVAADTYFEFTLAGVDPAGKPTSGIVYRETHIQLFGLDDRIKNGEIGGDNAWDPDRYLNIWVCNLTGGIVGYSSVVGCAKEKDGVVIRYNAFGTKGAATHPYNKGRTAVHEIGHWLGLRHIWGDRLCGDDEVGDTPPQQTATRGCPSGTIVSCSNTGGNMYMNYMDLTNDACMSMFTIGQRDRMRALFDKGGPRYPILSSNAGSVPPQELVLENETQPEPKKTIKLFPNPSIDRLVIDASDRSDLLGKEVTVYSQTGQALIRSRITSHTQSLNISTLTPGMYLVKLSGEPAALRFVKKL